MGVQQISSKPDHTAHARSSAGQREAATRAALWRLVCCLVAFACWSDPAVAQGSLARVLGGSSDGFEVAVQPREFRFPEDHGPHRRFRAEWWYFTGRMQAPGPTPREFGFQLTFFRFAMRPSRTGPEDAAQDSAAKDMAAKGIAAGKNATRATSSWRTNEVWMAHFAVTDAAAGTFHAAEQFARGGAVGLAGVHADPLTVYLRNWQFRTHDDAGFPWRLRAADAGVKLEVVLNSAEPIVLQGERGLSRKSAGRGNASYYYSMPRLRGTGIVQVDGRSFAGPVEAWLDREWSTSALANDQLGWDWFGLQLADDRELMLYGLRRADGTWDRFSAGMLVDANGDTTVLGVDDFELNPGEPTKLLSGRAYPLSWRIKVPAGRIDANVRAVMAEQEHGGRFPYWEGLVRVTDDAGNALGAGYLEMTGYDTPGAGG